MQDYLEKTETINKKSDFRDYSLSNNNIDDEYAAVISKISVDKLAELINKYPDHKYIELKKKIKKNFGISNVVLGSGSEDLIIRINLVLKDRGGIGIFVPSFYRITETAGHYTKILTKYSLNSKLVDFESISSQIGNHIKSVWITNPNPMIGKVYGKGQLIKLIKHHRSVLFIIDESSIDFVDNTKEYSLIDASQKLENLIIIRSFSKLYGVAGLRIGFATGRAKLLKRIERIGSTFPVNGLADYFIRSVLDNKSMVEKIRRVILKNKLNIEEILLSNKNIIISESATNCVFFKHKKVKIFDELLKLKVIALDLNTQEDIKEKNFVRLTVHSSKSLFNSLCGRISKMVDKI